MSTSSAEVAFAPAVAAKSEARCLTRRRRRRELFLEMKAEDSWREQVGLG